MSLEKALEELAAKQKPFSKFCSYQITLNSMPEKDKKALEAAWEKGYSANIIVRLCDKKDTKQPLNQSEIIKEVCADVQNR
jgi:secreted Zn-dependent insulinase-like peptidase